MTRNEFVTMTGITFALSTFALAGPGHNHESGHSDASSHPVCPVMGEPANLAVSTDTPEGPLFFCCERCVEKYEADPSKYTSAAVEQRKALADRPKIQTICPVSDKPVDEKVFIDDDGERVYFCCEGCTGKYQADPKKYASKLANSYAYQTTCPVMKKTIDPTSFTALKDGRKIYYCCDGCGDKLFDKPAKYAKALVDQGYQYNWSRIERADGDDADRH
jgi:YHS domain-containing protein